MKKILLCALGAFSVMGSPFAQAELPPDDVRLLNVAHAFHTCIAEQTQTALTMLPSKNLSSGVEAEGWVWNTALDKCYKKLVSYEVEAMVYQSYKGNSAEMRAFRDGLIWSARAYVFNELYIWLNALKK